MTERPMEIEHTRRFDHDSQFSDECKRDGCHAARLNFACEQSHGPRADWSGRYQQDEVHMGRRQQVRDLAARSYKLLGIIGMTKAIMGLSHSPYNTFRF